LFKRMGLLKRLVCLVVCICFVISMLSFSYAETTSTKDEITVTLNGQPLYFDVPPVLTDGRVLLPLRVIFDQLGAAVEWEGTEKKATVTRDDTVPDLKGAVVTPLQALELSSLLGIKIREDI